MLQHHTLLFLTDISQILHLAAQSASSWGQQNVTDGGAIGQQHDEAVHAEDEAARGGQTVLQSVDMT